MKEGQWEIQLKNFGGYCPAYFDNAYPFYGNKNQASAMTDVDITDPNVLTQGPGVTPLTGGTEAGELGSVLITAITKHALSDNAAYACGADKVFKITATAVSNSNFPKTIASGTANVATDVLIYQSKVLVFWNDTGVDGDIGLLTNDTTWDDNWGCYKDDTEVLTVKGWKLIKDVKSGEQIYSLNPKTQEVEIVINNETINKPYNGKMVNFISEGIDISVTPDHKMYAGFRKRVKGKDKRNIEYKVVRADSLFNKTNFKLKKNAIWNGEIVKSWKIPAYSNNINYKKEVKEIPIETFLTFLGFYLSEGCCRKNGQQIRISQSKEKNFYTWNIIKNNLDDLGLGYFENKRGDGFTINDKQFCEYIKSFAKGKSYEKYIPKEILTLDKSLLIFLYEAMMLGDGDDYGHYYTSSPQLRDDFIELVNKLGWSAKYNEKDLRGKKCLNGIVRYINYSILINKKKNEQTFNHHKKQKWGATVIKEQYNGNIVCLVLDKNHIMLVRRNGKSVWCGNSTVATGAAQLLDAPHYGIVGGDDVAYITNGRYIATVTNTTLNTIGLDFHSDAETASVSWNNNRVKIAVNRPNVSGSNFNLSAIYSWNGVSPSWEGDPIEVSGEIGALYTKNGITYCWWKDGISTGGYNLGFVNGTTLQQIRRYDGSLPSQPQVGEYKGILAWISSNKVMLWGSKDQNTTANLFQYVSPKDTTAGAFAAPFGTLLISSHKSAVFTAAVTDIITSAAHGLSNNDTVTLTTTSALPAGLSTATVYYVIDKTTDTFKLSATEGGGAIDITGTGTGVHTWHRYSMCKTSGKSVGARYKTIAFNVSGADYKSQIDLIKVKTKQMAAGAKCDITLSYDDAKSTKATTQIAYATALPTLHKILQTGPSVEDFRLDISWAEGSITNACDIISISILGHYVKSD